MNNAILLKTYSIFLSLPNHHAQKNASYKQSDPTHSESPMSPVWNTRKGAEWSLENVNYVTMQTFRTSSVYRVFIWSIDPPPASFIYSTYLRKLGECSLESESTSFSFLSFQYESEWRSNAATWPKLQLYSRAVVPKVSAIAPWDWSWETWANKTKAAISVRIRMKVW